MGYVLIILGLALFLALLAVVLIFVIKPGKKGLKQETFNRYWQQIEVLAKQNNQSSNKQAILDADKLLDLILKSRVMGKDLGARLKNSQKLFSSREIYQMAWEGHKLRNVIAHEIGFELSASESGRMINCYKRVFKDLGYIF